MSYLFQEENVGGNKRKSLRFTICVSGAASGETVKKASKLAEDLGAEIARHGHILTTGATVGLPFHAAVGAKRAGGMSVGFSPAASLREHLRKYRLPFEPFDFINFTGLEYVGRDLYLVQSSDAIITVGGRFGSLHEFTSALEAGKPCGVLVGSGGTADLIPRLMEVLESPAKSLVVYEKILKQNYEDIRKEFSRRDHFWYMQGSVHRSDKKRG